MTEMNENCVIKIENLSKEYRLGAIGSGTLRHDLQSWYAKKRGKEDPNQRIGAKQYTKGDTFLALDGVNLEVNRGERIGIIGANGAGKSTLGFALMGSPKYTLNSGEILFNEKNINDETPDKRSKNGIFLSFQSPLEVPGLSLSSFIRNALEKNRGKRIRLWDFKKELREAMELLQMDPSYSERDLNVGFSGGEKKKAEILQMLLLNPKLAILDETDSGLDVDAVRTVSKGVEHYQKNRDGALLIITHSTGILESLKVDYTHIMVNGHIVKTGDASLIDEINEHGFEKYLELYAEKF